MASVNKAIIVGRIGSDVELKYLTSGDAVANLSVATSEVWKDKSGEKQERAEWHRVILFRKLAEIAAEYLVKGSLVYIEGKLQTREWEKDGIKRYATEIIADRLQMLGSKGGENKIHANQDKSSEPKSDFSDMDSDIPF